MLERLNNRLENIRTSLWFLPTVLVAFSLVMAAASTEVDVWLSAQKSTIIPWLFSGTADAARTILSVIGGSLVTVISIAFSLTIIALQQASTQYSPRSLRTFMGSRTNQIVLGSYVATFIYSLVILRLVRSSSESHDTGFVPALSVTLALVLAGICLFLLIYFIHHIALSLQVGVVLGRIHRDLVAQIDTLYPSHLTSGAKDPPNAADEVNTLRRGVATVQVRSEQAGFLRRVDEKRILGAPLDSVEWLWIRPCVGDFVAHGAVLAEIGSCGSDHDELMTRIRASFVIDRTRSIEQDALFGIRQLVDIALRALSPSTNDPTSAEYVIFYLGDALGRLAQRQLPPSVRVADGGAARIFLSRPGWSDFVGQAFDQIRAAAASNIHVMQVQLLVLNELASRVTEPQRKAVVLDKIRQVQNCVHAHETAEGQLNGATSPMS